MVDLGNAQNGTRTGSLLLLESKVVLVKFLLLLLGRLEGLNLAAYIEELVG
jgi:hypothetical protein